MSTPAPDTFNIAANSIIAQGVPSSGQGLASLTRGTNITLAAGAIIGSQPSLTAALNTTTGTIQNLGTSADLFYGLTANQNNAAGSIDIGNGTAFQGHQHRSLSKNLATGHHQHCLGHDQRRFPRIRCSWCGPGLASLLETAQRVVLRSSTLPARARWTSAPSERSRSTMTLRPMATLAHPRMSGSCQRRVPPSRSLQRQAWVAARGIASALVQNGGILAIGNTAALNGAVTVESGGKFNANQAAGLTGTGALTFNAGSIIDITSHATGFSGSQATAASIAAGTIVRLGANSFGAAATTLDSVLGSGSNSPIFVIYGNNRGAADPTAPNTSILTLNKDSNGMGGILTNYEIGNRGLLATTNGVVTLGANGGTIAATTGYSLSVAEDITGSGSLTIGTTDIIDGLPKLGTVLLSVVNTYTGGTIVNAGTLQTNNTSALGSTSGQLTVNTGGTLNMNTVSLTVGNLTGTGGTITGISGNRTLTIGQGDTGGGNYQGSIQNGGGTTALTKTGTGTSPSPVPTPTPEPPPSTTANSS